MIKQDLWQAHYQILSIFFQEEFIILKIKCKYGHNDNKCETCIIKYKDCHCFHEYKNFEDDLIEYKCFVVMRNIRKRLMKN